MAQPEPEQPQGHGGPHLREFFRGGTADALGSTGDDADFSCQATFAGGAVMDARFGNLLPLAHINAHTAFAPFAYFTSAGEPAWQRLLFYIDYIVFAWILQWIFQKNTDSRSRKTGRQSCRMLT